jgi:pimeloyl-ACP methyl ester carboxylesterase
VSRMRAGDALPDSRLAEALRLDETTGQVALDPDLGPQLLYGEAPPELRAAAAARLRPAHRAAFRGVPDAIAWRTVPSTYVVCATDQVVHPERQRAMAQRATRAVEWPSGHSPAVVRPQLLADLVAERVAAV